MAPIGYIKSCYPDKFGTPRQPGLVKTSWAQLKIERHLQPEEALAGIEEFSHLWLLFLFHGNSNIRYHAKVHPPRLAGRSIGLFATRSPHRPNPIGLSLVELEKVEGDTLTLRGIDLIDGTPILDIKPYLPAIESVPQARAGWTQDAEDKAIDVEISVAIENEISAWSKRIGRSDLRKTIVQTLGLDPRPLVYRGYEGLGSHSPYRAQHAVRLFDGDIHFEFLSPEKIRIIRICFNADQEKDYGICN